MERPNDTQRAQQIHVEKYSEIERETDANTQRYGPRYSCRERHRETGPYRKRHIDNEKKKEKGRLR